MKAVEKEWKQKQKKHAYFDIHDSNVEQAFKDGWNLAKRDTQKQRRKSKGRTR